jgi:Domain of unknown function (DUF5600)
MKYGLHDADMPNIDKFRSKLAKVDFSAFPAVRAATLQQLDDIISADIPRVSAICSRALRDCTESVTDALTTSGTVPSQCAVAFCSVVKTKLQRMLSLLRGCELCKLVAFGVTGCMLYSIASTTMSA